MFVIRTELLVQFKLICFERDSGYSLNYTDALLHIPIHCIYVTELKLLILLQLLPK
jgi:hypothetical protein